MAEEKKPLSIAEHKRRAKAEAALDQMFDYFTREDNPRAVVTDLDARKVA